MMITEKNIKKYYLERKKHLNYDEKIKDVYLYLKTNNIKNILIGVSGGIDSFLVLMILLKIKNDLLKDLNIYVVHIKFDLYKDVFVGQSTIDFVKEINNINYLEYDFTSLFNLNMNFLNIDDNNVLANSSYAYRYWIFFTLAQNYNAITIGTTNLDELSYVGWFGKNSDMVVDIQIISDLHKVEVYEMSNFLFENLFSGYKKIDCLDKYKMKPSGDLLDSSTDEDNFGVSYEELGFYSYLKCKGFNLSNNKFNLVEQLHNKNKHKYYGQSFNPYFIINNNLFFIYKTLHK